VTETRLYLVAIAFAFAGSALLMVGTLSSFPAWLDLYQFNVVNYNDAMIFYMFRHLLMAVLFIVRQYCIPRAIAPFTAGAYRYCEREFLFTALAWLAWMYSSHSSFYPLIWLIMKPAVYGSLEPLH
jgi:hypothetical protein